MQIGFIGLGNLGTPIAENLLSAHQHLFVYNRTSSKTIPLAEKGATVCQTIPELAAQCDIVFSIVADDKAMKEITLGENGIAKYLKAGGIHASISTILPVTANELAAAHKDYGSSYIAIPVMGRPDAARAHKLNFLISGDTRATGIVKPLLTDAGAVTIWEFGEDAGAANVAKLCNNFLIIAALEAIAEGITLAKNSGIDTAQWIKMLTSTFMNAPI
jgi:3-hydroxyisobutyrate dehydrogenase-like beta-hydroxyacid dehydrogenase